MGAHIRMLVEMCQNVCICFREDCFVKQNCWVQCHISYAVVPIFGAQEPCRDLSGQLWRVKPGHQKPIYKAVCLQVRASFLGLRLLKEHQERASPIFLLRPQHLHGASTQFTVLFCFS